MQTFQGKGITDCGNSNSTSLHCRRDNLLPHQPPARRKAPPFVITPIWPSLSNTFRGLCFQDVKHECSVAEQESWLHRHECLQLHPNNHDCL